MGKKVRVALHGEQRRSAMIDLQATDGAIVGTNLRWADGSLITDSQIRNTASSSTGGSTTVVGGSSGVTLWQLIVGIPQFIASLAALTTVGFVVRDSSGDAQTRTLQGETGRFLVLNGDGDAANPTLLLGPYPTVKNSVEDVDVCNIAAGHQMIVVDEFVVDGGELNVDGELIVL